MLYPKSAASQYPLHYIGKAFIFIIRNRRIFIFFNILILLLSVAGCGCNDTNYTAISCSEKNFDSNCFPKPDSSKKSLPPAHLGTINIFVETSLSMIGYMPAKDSATEFQQIIPEMLSSLNTAYPQKVNFYSIYNSSQAFKKFSLEDSRNRIFHGQFDWNGTTYLPAMLDTVMTKYLKPDVVNVFISDCIYSPKKGDTKTTSLAITDIRDETYPLAKNYSTLMVALTSRFVAKKTTANSPYYMIIQGKPENLEPVKNDILTSVERYNGLHKELNFEHPQKNPEYSVLPYTDKSSNFSAEAASTYNGDYVKLDRIDLTSAKELSFWIGIDLKKLPEYAQTPDYIKKNISLSVDQGTATVTDVRNSPPQNLNKDDKSFADKYTHFIKIKLIDLTGDVGALKLSLKYTRPQWVHDQNETDPAKENVRNKTLGLEKMVTGYEEAYGLDKNYYFFNNLTLSLIKKL